MMKTIQLKTTTNIRVKTEPYYKTFNKHPVKDSKKYIKELKEAE